MKTIREKGRKAANAVRAARTVLTKNKIDGAGQATLKEMFKYIKGGKEARGSSIWDSETKKHIFDLMGQHAIMIREGRTVFDKHKNSPPNWEKLAEAYGKFEPGTTGAPQRVPTAHMLHKKAQNSKEEASGGPDGWNPAELKALPLHAWGSRAQVLKLAGELGTFPIKN